MNILQKFKYPFIFITEYIIKIGLKRLLFKNIESNDFKRLFSITLELLPHETFINIIKLLINTYKSKPTELYNFKIFDEAIIHSIPSSQRFDILGRLKVLFIFLMLGNIIKRILFIIKYIILLPFHIGVYSFIAFLFGIRVDYLLSFFDYFKFNLPS